MNARLLIALVALYGGTFFSIAQHTNPLAGTVLLTNSGDLSAQMVAGIDRWLGRETEQVAARRAQRWRDAFAEPRGNDFTQFLAGARQRLRAMIGAVDPISPAALEFVADERRTAEVHRGRPFVASRVRWRVFENVHGEGLLLEPLRADGTFLPARATVIALPDADQSPEMISGLRPGVEPHSQFARVLAENGWRVLVPVLVSREDTFSGNERIKRFTNQPHREWIYRQAYELGRHIIGYEVQKVLAGISAVERTAPAGSHIAVAGYGEGGLIALHAAAIDARINATLVSGYFGEREQLWREPIYRNLFGFVREFGDAELAALIAPRQLVLEYSRAPNITGPPVPSRGRGGAAPGTISTPEFGEFESEVDRALQLTKSLRGGPHVQFVHGSEGSAVQFGSRKALALLARAAGDTNDVVLETRERAVNAAPLNEATNRQERAVRELEAFTQTLFRRSERVRDERTWKALSTTNEFLLAAARDREFFWRDVMGRIDAPGLPVNARTRQLFDQRKWTGYEVMLDVFPDVFAWGYLLVPKDLKPGERRPVVVCQHGLEGLPEDTVAEDPKHSGFHYYKGFAAKLAERGFVVYAPHNPYRGQDKFRVLQRKANPLGLSLFSFIIAQHEATTDWLASLPFVDAPRIAFYGLSYGGKTAMRVPAVVERYCLSICSADFNEWIQKNVTVDSPYSYMFTGEYEMPEWNLGHTFNYAEMASLIAPRPFMVERGHDDGVAPDTWVAYEYAKVRRMYNKLGLGDRTEIEFFDGPHTIHGVGTFRFLHRHLNWPEPK